MASTTNFGWQTPDDTDLVKDGAAAIRTLGSAIDTSLVDLKGGTTGQVLSKNTNSDMDFTWVTPDDADAIQNSIVDAKGDLIAASANDTPARLAVGNNGDTLVADSSASTGLRWQGNFAAGKNAIINGDFRINQRGFTSTTTDGAFGFDRWFLAAADGTTTYTPQTFTPGAAPVAGYEAINFARIVSTGQTLSSAYSWLRHRIEDVRVFANQTATVSFWAKAATGTPKIAVELAQQFGSGGSSQVATYAGQVTLSTSWARYSVTIAVPSITGKTIGAGSSLTLNLMFSAGSDYNSRSGSLGIQSNTFDIWGVQVEAGSVATAFQTATGTLAGELAACQRYYVRFNDPTNTRGNIGSAIRYSGTNALALVYLPVTMRVAPTAVESASLEVSDVEATNIAITAVTLASTYASNKTLGLDLTAASGFVANRPYFLRQANTTAGYLGVIAEL